MLQKVDKVQAPERTVEKKIPERILNSKTFLESTQKLNSEVNWKSLHPFNEYCQKLQNMYPVKEGTKSTDEAHHIAKFLRRTDSKTLIICYHLKEFCRLWTQQISTAFDSFLKREQLEPFRLNDNSWKSFLEEIRALIEDPWTYPLQPLPCVKKILAFTTVSRFRSFRSQVKKIRDELTVPRFNLNGMQFTRYTITDVQLQQDSDKLDGQLVYQKMQNFGEYYVGEKVGPSDPQNSTQNKNPQSSVPPQTVVAAALPEPNNARVAAALPEPNNARVAAALPDACQCPGDCTKGFCWCFRNNQKCTLKCHSKKKDNSNCKNLQDDVPIIDTTGPKSNLNPASSPKRQSLKKTADTASRPLPLCGREYDLRIALYLLANHAKKFLKPSDSNEIVLKLALWNDASSVLRYPWEIVMMHIIPEATVFDPANFNAVSLPLLFSIYQASETHELLFEVGCRLKAQLKHLNETHEILGTKFRFCWCLHKVDLPALRKFWNNDCSGTAKYKCPICSLYFDTAGLNNYMYHDSGINLFQSAEWRAIEKQVLEEPSNHLSAIPTLNSSHSAKFSRPQSSPTVTNSNSERPQTKDLEMILKIVKNRENGNNAYGIRIPGFPEQNLALLDKGIDRLHVLLICKVLWDSLIKARLNRKPIFDEKAFLKWLKLSMKHEKVSELHITDWRSLFASFDKSRFTFFECTET